MRKAVVVSLKKVEFGRVARMVEAAVATMLANLRIHLNSSHIHPTHWDYLLV